jgi:hypothetical protein
LLLGFPDESQAVQSPSANLKRCFGFTFPPCGIVLHHFHPRLTAPEAQLMAGRWKVMQTMKSY